MDSATPVLFLRKKHEVGLRLSTQDAPESWAPLGDRMSWRTIALSRVKRGSIVLNPSTGGWHVSEVVTAEVGQRRPSARDRDLAA